MLDDDKYTDMVALAGDFEKTIATKLNIMLTLKSWWRTNYVSDWWIKYGACFENSGWGA